MDFPQLQCLVIDHQMKEIICICSSKDCTKQRLCCLSCIQTFHRGHEVQDFRDYINWRKQGFDVFNRLSQSIVQLEQSIKYFKELIQENFIDTNANLINMTTEQINNEVNKLHKIKQFHSQVNQFLSKSNDQLIEALLVLSNNKGACEKISAITFDIKFDTSCKSKNLTLENNQTEAKSFNNFINYCFCEKPISRNSSQTFAFFIENCNEGHVYLGIAHKNLWKIYNEEPNLNECGHGMYLIRNDGYTYSHHQDQMNVKQQKFRFCTNDTIIVEVDYIKSKLSWINNVSEQTFTMQFDNQSEMYPVVGLKRSHISIVRLS